MNEIAWAWVAALAFTAVFAVSWRICEYYFGERKMAEVEINDGAEIRWPKFDPPWKRAKVGDWVIIKTIYENGYFKVLETDDCPHGDDKNRRLRVSRVGGTSFWVANDDVLAVSGEKEAAEDGDVMVGDRVAMKCRVGVGRVAWRSGDTVGVVWKNGESQEVERGRLIKLYDDADWDGFSAIPKAGGQANSPYDIGVSPRRADAIPSSLNMSFALHGGVLAVDQVSTDTLKALLRFAAERGVSLDHFHMDWREGK